MNPRMRPLARRIATRPWVTCVAHRFFSRSRQVLSGERELARRISTRIAADDAMFRGDFGHYFSVGLSAIRRVDDVLRTAGAMDPATILDLPCGHGRVLRWLAARFPRARITACEIDAPALEFCARELGAEPVASLASFRDLALPASYDLIWCGSLLTHLAAAESFDLLDLLARHLAPGGVLVFSTHGELVARRVEQDPASYRLPASELPRVLESWRDGGHAHWTLSGLKGYGVSLASGAWVRTQVAGLSIPVQEIYFRPEGWDDHQDVFAFRRAPSSDPAAAGREGAR